MDAAGIIGKVMPRNTKVGITYSFTLDDRSDERWFGTYKTVPPVEGTYVEFEYVQSGAFNNVDMKTLKATQPETAQDDQGGSTAAPAAAPAAKAAYKGAGNKDANIQWQSARNAGIAALGVLSDAGALSLGSGKAEAKLEAFLIQLNALTVEFFDQSMVVSDTGDAPEDFRG